MKKSFLALALVLGFGSLQAQPVVDLVLYLSVDVSGSILDADYELQRTGYVNAFASTGVKDYFDGTGYTMAVAYSEWSTVAGSSNNFTDFYIVDSPEDSQAFSDVLSGLSRQQDNLTGIARAINFASSTITAAKGTKFQLAEDARVVLDISSDGKENVNYNSTVRNARDNALAADVTTINGLVIGGTAGYPTYSEAQLVTYFTNNVIGGPNAFVLGADGFEDFGRAIQDKLVREINPEIPEPTTVGLMGVLGIAGFVYYNRRRQKAAPAPEAAA
jgi:hypothetical protein